MKPERALEIAKDCEVEPIDTLEVAAQCIRALKISLDVTDEAVFGAPEAAAVSVALVLLAGYVLRQAFKLARLQGEFTAYRSGRG